MAPNLNQSLGSTGNEIIDKILNKTIGEKDLRYLASSNPVPIAKVYW